jgi:hypothetical protein
MLTSKRLFLHAMKKNTQLLIVKTPQMPRLPLQACCFSDVTTFKKRGKQNRKKGPVQDGGAKR